MSNEILPIFNHSGNFGDILYSLPFCMELIKHMDKRVDDFSFNIQINQKADYSSEHPYGNVTMTKGAAEFLHPLLSILGFKEVTISETIPNNWMNLSMFRKLRLNLTSGNLKSHYYELCKFHLPKDFSINYFHFMEKNLYPELNDKILLIHTSRYNNTFLDLKALKPYKEKLMFIGLKSEHDAFQKEFFDIEYLPTDNDATEVAYCMLSAKGVIGNQSGLFALAETLKVPRILLTAEFNMIQNRLCIGPCNVECTGGWFEYVRTQQKLIPAIDNLMNKENK